MPPKANSATPTPATGIALVLDPRAGDAFLPHRMLVDRLAEGLALLKPAAHLGERFLGNAAEDATSAVVFAKLVTRGIDHGVHALIVPIRDEHGAPLPGVEITDEVADGPQSLILTQVANGVAVRMACLDVLTRSARGVEGWA